MFGRKKTTCTCVVDRFLFCNTISQTNLHSTFNSSPFWFWFWLTIIPPSSQCSQHSEFSLQNGLEVAGRSLGHQPRHGSREILIICGALSTCDPGHILTETLPRLMAANIRVSTFALSAELHICRKIAEVTGGAMGVCLDKGHMRDWLLEQCVPPPAIRKELLEFGCEMVQMGFPTRTKSEIPTLVSSVQWMIHSLANKIKKCNHFLTLSSPVRSMPHVTQSCCRELRIRVPSAGPRYRSFRPIASFAD